MAHPVIKDFTQLAAQASGAPNKQINMLMMGHGKMGKPHLAALLRYGQWLQAVHGVTLNVGVVEKDPVKLAAAPAGVQRFENMEDALSGFAPGLPLHGVVSAFNDRDHAPAYRRLFAQRPEVSFILAEKPITETIEEARELLPEFSKRYVSLNTIINFSPAFDVYHASKSMMETYFGPLAPIGYQSVWGKDRTQDARPSIGVRSESIHALGVIQEVLSGEDLSLVGGKMKVGYLAAGAQDVPFSVDLHLRTSRTSVPVDFDCSYELPDQSRRITQYLRSGKGEVFAAEFQFDCITQKDAGRLDQLSIFQIDPSTGHKSLLLRDAPAQVETSLPFGVMPNDKIGAWIGRSMTDVLHQQFGVMPQQPVRNMSYLNTATVMQELIETIDVSNHRLDRVFGQQADPSCNPPKYMSVDDMEPTALRLLLNRYQGTASAPKPVVMPLRPAI